MKKTFVNMALLIATGFVALSVAPRAWAQRVPDMRIDIPFDFQVADRTLAAGSYDLTVGDIYRRVDLRSADGHTIFLTGNPSDRTPGERSILVFKKYGSTYFLSEIVSSRQPFGLTVPVSKAEKALVNVAGMRPVVETIAAGSR